MGCCWIILRTGREVHPTAVCTGQYHAMMHACYQLYSDCISSISSSICHSWCVFLTSSFFSPLLHPSLTISAVCLSRPNSALASLCASDLLLREDPIQVKACFNAFLAESFCTSHCVMCANAQHPPSASPQCFSCCRHTHISAVFSPLTSSLRLFISSSLRHCLPFCCTLTAFLLFILAWPHPLTPPFLYITVAQLVRRSAVNFLACSPVKQSLSLTNRVSDEVAPALGTSSPYLAVLIHKMLPC